MDLLSFLNSIDLNGYEREIVLQLALVESADAKVLYTKTSVPKGRIYQVLQELQHKGFIEVIPTSPKRYKINDIKESLKRYLDQRKNTLDEKINLITSIEMDTKKALLDEKAPSVTFLDGREEHLQAVVVLRDLAKKEIWQVAPIFIGTFQTNLSLKRALKRGIKIKILTSAITKENKKQVNDWLSNGGEIRLNPKLGMHFMIRDSEEFLLGVHDRNNYEKRMTIKGQSTDLLKVLTKTFEEMWKEAKPVK